MKDEEMAEEYRKDLKSKFFLSEPQLDLACQGYKDGFKEGAEFGYNKAKVEVEDSYRESLCNSELNLASVTEQLEELEKANEWHYVKDGDYPKEKGNYLVAWKRTHHVEEFGEWGFDVNLFNADEGYFEGVGDYVIAWKEIVLPELPKESE